VKLKRVAIVGGGIAGLSAAYYLEKAKRDAVALEWTLFEKSGRLGGVIRTENRDGYVLEAGPDSFLTIKPDAAELCRELGIGDQLIPSNDAQRKTYILVKGRLVPIPDGLLFMVPTRLGPMLTTPLFSWGTKLRAAAELLTSPGSDRGDESVGDFVRRHFGQQMVDRVAEPLLAGVYGGNADKLSMRAVLPRFVAMERESGSLARATLRARRQAAGSAARGQPLFTSLRLGMQQMVDRLLEMLPQSSLKLHQGAISLRRTSDAWRIECPGATGEFDSVFLAIPAPASAALLSPLDPALASHLAQIGYTSSVAVALAYDRADLPAGHGFLVPRTERRKLLACTFVHNKFPHRAPEGAALLRCFFSSARVPDLLSHDDAALQALARQELREIVELRAEARFTGVFRWECALPQYETGHLERVAEMEKWLAQMPGMEIIGNSFHGIGISDCIRSARQAVARVTASALQPASV
jgi:protoporphyrinogen/coproporphyrinogen III oxidase